MSNFNPEDFESPQNITVPIETRVIRLNEDGLSTQFKINSQNQFGKIIAKFKIVNEDPNSVITYRIPSPSGALRTVPLNTSTTVEEYTYYLEINFSASNTESFVELDLIKASDGKKRSSLVGRGAA